MARWPSQGERYWSYVAKRGPDECWTWLGPIDSHGYGQLTWNGKMTLAHRVALTMSGVELGSLYALHRCDNPPCVNPAHLFAGTAKDNCSDMFKKGRARRARGDSNGARRHPETRPRGEAHGGSRLTIEAVKEILGSEEGGPALASRFSVHRSTIGKIRRGEVWSHIGGAL